MCMFLGQFLMQNDYFKYTEILPFLNQIHNLRNKMILEVTIFFI